MTPAPLQLGHAPSELELNSAGFTPLAFANALRIGSSRPVYVAGLLRREPRIAPWSITTTPSRPETEPLISELLPEPATPVTTQSTPRGMSTSTSWRLFVEAPRISRVPEGVRTVSLRVARSSRWRPGDPQGDGADTLRHPGDPRRFDEQPPGRGRRHPPRSALRGHRRRRLRQELADQRLGLRPRRRCGNRPGRDPRLTTEQPGDVHRPARPDPQGVREGQRSEAGAVQLQLRGRLPHLQGCR